MYMYGSYLIIPHIHLRTLRTADAENMGGGWWVGLKKRELTGPLIVY